MASFIYLMIHWEKRSRVSHMSLIRQVNLGLLYRAEFQKQQTVSLNTQKFSSLCLHHVCSCPTGQSKFYIQAQSQWRRTLPKKSLATRRSEQSRAITAINRHNELFINTGGRKNLTIWVEGRLDYYFITK